jgi:hypothetical protein
VTPSGFKALFPKFMGESDERIQALLNLAAPYFNVERWGAFYPEGIANWVAHSIVVDNAEGAQPTDQLNANDVTEKHVGPVGMTRDSQLLNAQAKNPFMRTTYGQKYVYLRGKVGFGGLAV